MVHLRMCMSCGKIGCCDSSPNRQATRHAGELGCPIIRSAEPGEVWSWCYLDNFAFVLEAP
jgi:Zn-finger in ubiquitin-hydrolases and other protein